MGYVVTQGQIRSWENTYWVALSEIQRELIDVRVALHGHSEHIESLEFEIGRLCAVCEEP